MKYYCSDLHLGHANIITMCKRPYKDVKEMDEDLIKRWNKKVKSSDEVYFLGDFSFKTSVANSLKMLARLNGKKYFIRGNHDPERFLRQALEKGLIEWWGDYLDLEDNGKRVILSHYPFHSWNGLYRGSYHLYGHVHNQTVQNEDWQKNRFNASVEVNNYEPVSLDELIATNIPAFGHPLKK